MARKICTVFVVALLVGAAGVAQEADKKAAGKIEGSWTVKDLTYDGAEHKLKFNIVFKGDEGKVEGNDKVTNEYSKIKFKLDPSTKPMSMDITVSGGSQTDAKMKAIYELKDDELHICAKVFGSERPKEFAAPDGSSCVLLVLKRAAP